MHDVHLINIDQTHNFRVSTYRDLNALVFYERRKGLVFSVSFNNDYVKIHNSNGELKLEDNTEEVKVSRALKEFIEFNVDNVNDNNVLRITFDYHMYNILLVVDVELVNDEYVVNVHKWSRIDDYTFKYTHYHVNVNLLQNLLVS